MIFIPSPNTIVADYNSRAFVVTDEKIDEYDGIYTSSVPPPKPQPDDDQCINCKKAIHAKVLAGKCDTCCSYMRRLKKDRSIEYLWMLDEANAGGKKTFGGGYRDGEYVGYKNRPRKWKLKEAVPGSALLVCTNHSAGAEKLMGDEELCTSCFRYKNETGKDRPPILNKRSKEDHQPRGVCGVDAHTVLQLPGAYRTAQNCEWQMFSLRLLQNSFYRAPYRGRTEDSHL